MTLLTETTTVKRREDLIAQEMDGEMVMLDMASGNYFGLDSVASAIWQRIEQPVALKTLCQDLEAQYDVSHERCYEDVSSFLSELAEKGLVDVQ